MILCTYIRIFNSWISYIRNTYVRKMIQTATFISYQGFVRDLLEYDTSLRCHDSLPAIIPFESQIRAFHSIARESGIDYTVGATRVYPQTLYMYPYPRRVYAYGTLWSSVKSPYTKLHLLPKLTCLKQVYEVIVPYM